MVESRLDLFKLTENRSGGPEFNLDAKATSPQIFDHSRWSVVLLLLYILPGPGPFQRGPIR